MKKVGIILVNYKEYAGKYLKDCCESLRRQTYPRDLFQVCIVDNASSEDSVRLITETCPEARVIPRQDGNYAAANNEGLRVCIQDGCELVTLVNMDTEMDPAWLEELVKAFEDDARVGLAQSRILLYPRTEDERKSPRINTVGNHFHFLGFGYPGGYGTGDVPLSGITDIAGYASGCSLMARSELLVSVGMYDEDLYMYHDDIDISLKVKLMGYRTVLAPRSIVYHKYEFERSVRMLYFMERNRYLILFQYYSWPLLLLILPALLVMDLSMFTYSLVGHWVHTKLKVYRYFLSCENWKRICSRRKGIRQMSRISDAEFIRGFVGEIRFGEIDNVVLRYVANPLMSVYWKIVRRVLGCPA